MNCKKENGYIGWHSSKRSAQGFIRLLRCYGIAATIKAVDGSTIHNAYSVWAVNHTQAPRAREIRRGFKYAMMVRTDPPAFLLGAVHAIILKFSKKQPKMNSALEQAVKLLQENM